MDTYENYEMEQRTQPGEGLHGGPGNQVERQPSAQEFKSGTGELQGAVPASITPDEYRSQPSHVEKSEKHKRDRSLKSFGLVALALTIAAVFILEVLMWILLRQQKTHL